jgi:hypothetical protein
MQFETGLTGTPYATNRRRKSDKNIYISKLCLVLAKVATSPSNLTCGQLWAFPQIRSGDKVRKSASSSQLDGVSKHK